MVVTDSDMDFPALDRFSEDYALVLSAQVHVLRALETLFPEVAAAGWRDEVHSLAKDVQRLRDATIGRVPPGANR